MAGTKGMKQFRKELIVEVLNMRKEGKTYREIAEQMGYRPKQIKQLVERYNYKKKHTPEIKVKGRPRKTVRSTQEQLEYENKQLRMENELLKAFLKQSERGDVN